MEHVIGNRLRRSRYPALLAATVGLSAVAGCGGQAAQPVRLTPDMSGFLTPDMSGFLQPGSSDTCLNGGPRPCGVQIRLAPKLASACINVAACNRASVRWPLERYQQQGGDPVTIDCVVSDGERVSDFKHDPSSAAWYQVRVPSEQIVSPEAASMYDHSVQTTQDDEGHKLLLGYASIEWFGQTHADPRVPQC